MRRYTRVELTKQIRTSFICLLLIGHIKMTMPRDWPYKAKGLDNNDSRIVASDSNNETEDKDRDQLIFDLIKRRYDSELEINNSFDTKASSLVGFVSILIGLLFVNGTFELSVITSNPILSTSYFLGTSLLVGSIIFSLLAFRIRRFIIVPDVSQLLNEYSDRPYLEVLKRTGATMQVAVETSKKRMQTRQNGYE